MTRTADTLADNEIRLQNARDLDLLETQLAVVNADFVERVAHLDTIQNVVAAATIYKTAVDREATAKKAFIDATPGSLEVLDVSFDAAEIASIKTHVVTQLTTQIDILKALLDII